MAELVGQGTGEGMATPGRGFLALTYSPLILSGIVMMLDVAILCGAGAIIYALYVGWQGETALFYAAIMALTIGAVVGLFHRAGLYRFDALTRPGRRMGSLAANFAVALLAIAALAFALKISNQISRVWGFSWAGTSFLLLMGARFWLHRVIRALGLAGRLTRNVVLVGTDDRARDLLARLRFDTHPWARILGCFSVDNAPVELDTPGFEVLGGIGELASYVRWHRVDDVIVVLPWDPEARLDGILEQLGELPVNVRLASKLEAFRSSALRTEDFLGVPLMSVYTRPVADWDGIAKQVEDYVLTSIFLLFALPLMAGIAVLVKFGSPGPVFFRQKRYGFNNRIFMIYKFRSMADGAEPVGEVAQARRGDPRVTAVGRWLRRTSLDELPQLFNVLKGDMSLVGPRPHAVEHNHLYSQEISRYYARHRVKPGLTGWAQINGYRGETETTAKMEKRIEYDLYYIENWSIAFDLRILLSTISAILRGTNSY